jgi:glycerophosphoryl diester phosphodiesterase
MLILSHRGYHEHHPDNTLGAFAEAAALGVDGIETDVRLSADGQAILFHDRVIDDGQLVERLSLPQLNSQVGYDVPTLASALDRWPELFWNVEIKTPTAVEAALAVLADHAAHRVLVTSAWHPLIEHLGNSHRFDTGIIVNHCPLHVPFPSSDTGNMRSSIRSVVWAYEFLDVELVVRTAAQGIRNFVWGAQTAADFQHCLELNLTGVIVDRPEWLLLARERNRGSS